MQLEYTWVQNLGKAVALHPAAMCQFASTLLGAFQYGGIDEVNELMALVTTFSQQKLVLIEAEKLVNFEE